MSKEQLTYRDYYKWTEERAVEHEKFDHVWDFDSRSGLAYGARK